LGKAATHIVQLLRHPNSGWTPARELDVEVIRLGSVLSLRFAVRGDVAQISMPPARVPARVDGLWQHTCFEAFVRGAASSDRYWEFNLSPSRHWAAYRFDHYREGMAPEPAAADPQIEILSDDRLLRLSAELDLSAITALRAHDAWQLGLSAVIEDRDGGKSWWALAHLSESPDFHRSDSFTLRLAP